MALAALLARGAGRPSAAWLVCSASLVSGCSGEVVNLGSSGLQAGGSGSLVPFHTWSVQSAPIIAQVERLLLANPTLTNDERELFYSVQERGGNPEPNKPHVERRSWDGNAWGTAQKQTLGELSDPDVSSPAISPAGDELWLGMIADGNTDIFRCLGGPNAWSAPVRVAELSSVDADDAPRPPAHGGTIMPLSSKRHGGPFYQIYLATRASRDAAWGEPSKALLATIDFDDFQSADGFLSSDGLELYFSSTRDGQHLDSDLYVARRSALEAAFGEPEALLDLNDPLPGEPSEERMPWLSADKKQLFFVSNRSGLYGLYQATKL